MSSISVSENTKSEFDSMKPDSMTHDEFVAELLETYEYADEPVKIDTGEIIQEISDKVATDIEFAARRGVIHGLEEQ